MRYGVVKVSTADLRKRPSHRSEMVSQGLLGDVMRIEGPAVGDGWFRVSLPDGYTGWMRSWNVAPLTRAEASKWLRLATAMVITPFAEALADRRASACRTRDLVLGCSVIPITKRGSWIRIKLPDGESGWVRSSALARRKKPRPTGAGVIKTARLFLGCPYLWGGVSPKGVDCSGLVQTAYRVQGVSLPRDVSDLRHCGDSVDSGFLKAGDLLFFGQSETKLSHVAISTGGTGFIHAGCPVQEESLDPRQRNYARELAPLFRLARRILF